MQVTVEEKGALERRIVVTIPAERISVEMNRRLEDLGKKSRIKGFRPGKAPARVVRQRYGASVKEEVVDELMRIHYAEAITQEKLSPVDLPRLIGGETGAGGDYTFTAEFEIFPEFELADEDSIRLLRPQVEITPDDVAVVIERLRQQRGEWKPVERPARQGDQVIIDFEGTIDNEPFDGNAATGMAVTLGAGELIPGFEQGLEGIRAAEKRTLDLEFPKDYHKPELAGRPVHFDITAQRVEERVLPELDDEFARSFGVTEGGLDTLREKVRENMAAELDERVRSDLVKQIGEQLIAANPIAVPKALVEQEITRQQRSTLRRLGIAPDAAQTPQLPREPYQEEAERRVRLGLILSRLIERRALRPDPARVESRIAELSAQSENPQARARAMRGDKEAMRGIEAMILEDMVYDQLLEQATFEDQPQKFFDFMEPSAQQEEDAANE